MNLKSEYQEINGLHQLQLFLSKYASKTQFNKIYNKILEVTKNYYGSDIHFIFSKEENSIYLKVIDTVEKDEIKTINLKQGNRGLCLEND